MTSKQEKKIDCLKGVTKINGEKTLAQLPLYLMKN